MSPLVGLWVAGTACMAQHPTPTGVIPGFRWAEARPACTCVCAHVCISGAQLWKLALGLAYYLWFWSQAPGSPAELFFLSALKRNREANGTITPTGGQGEAETGHLGDTSTEGVHSAYCCLSLETNSQLLQPPWN